MNVTLVAFYGEKPSPIEDLVTGLQAELERALDARFRPYALEQVHATVIGLEGRRVGGCVLNTNHLEARRQTRAMDLDAVFAVLRDATYIPLTVRIGGYGKGATFPFKSRGLHPHLRSFSLQGQIAVAMGWPFDRGDYPQILDRLRRRLGEAGALHKYHAKAADEDNDFFFVLGRVLTNELQPKEIQRAEDRLRDYLARRKPLDVTVGRDALSLIAYVDETLPLETSCSFSLDVAEQRRDEILSSYKEGDGLSVRWS